MRIGFDHAREGATLAYTHKVSTPGGRDQIVAVERMRALGEPLGTDRSAPAEYRIPISALARRSAEAMAPPACVAIVPGARWSTKRWPIDRYLQLTQQILDSGQGVILLGSPDEKPLCDQIQSQVSRQGSSCACLIKPRRAGRTTHLGRIFGPGAAGHRK